MWANPQTCSTAAPAPGTEGNPVNISAEFDGWGYTHLLPQRSRTPSRRSTPTPSRRPWTRARPPGFGDLTVHEFATDATENLAYSSYYAGGLRVFSFGDNGLKQVGKFIDQGGNDFWGVEDFTTANGERLIASFGSQPRPVCVPVHGAGRTGTAGVLGAQSATAPVGAAVSVR